MRRVENGPWGVRGPQGPGEERTAAPVPHRVRALLRGLRRLYPDARCELDFKTPLQLLVATILSAQCTDKRVNQVTPALFARYKTARDFAAAGQRELEGRIRSTGFFRSKARSIRESCRALAERFGGEPPRSMEELLTLRGVARKSANVILQTAYGVAAGVVVDTHVGRLARRMGLSEEKDPVRVERELMALLPRADWMFFGQAMTWHGRRVCRARGPDCWGCSLRQDCARRGI